MMDRQPCARHPDRASVRRDVAACWRTMQKQAKGMPGQWRVALSHLDIEEAVLARAIRPATGAAIAVRRR